MQEQKCQQDRHSQEAPVASPDKIKNTQLFFPISLMPVCAFVRKTIPHAITGTTNVRIAVARLEFTPSIPILASIDVRAANKDDNTANNNHIFYFSFRVRTY